MACEGDKSALHTARELKRAYDRSLRQDQQPLFELGIGVRRRHSSRHDEMFSHEGDKRDGQVA